MLRNIKKRMCGSTTLEVVIDFEQNNFCQIKVDNLKRWTVNIYVYNIFIFILSLFQ